MFDTYFQFWQLKKNLLFVGPIDWVSAAFTLLFIIIIFFFQLPISKLTEPKTFFFFFSFLFFLQPPTPKLTKPKLLSSIVHRLPLHPLTEPSTQLKKNHHHANHKTSNQSIIADPAIHTTTFNTTTNYTIELRKN